MLRRTLFFLLTLLVISNTDDLLAQSKYPFVPKNFTVPDVLETKAFRLRMLTVNDLVKDYDAVMSSEKHIQKIWDGAWPKGLTLEQSLVQLGWHQREFQRRRSFAYTVVNLDESRVLGAVYINPTRKVGYDAVVYLWARQSELSSGLESQLREKVRKWVKQQWPFERVIFPGTDMPWQPWYDIPETKR